MKFWDSVTLYNFVLTMLVIWLHLAGFDQVSAAEDVVVVSLRVREIIGNGLGQVAVPGFFLMSGFLFFRNLENFKTSYGPKFPNITTKADKSTKNQDIQRTNILDKNSVIIKEENTLTISWPGFGFFFEKWKRRIFSILIPYLFWNFFYYIIYLFSGRAPLNMESILSAIFFHRYNPVFWYLRQLIVLTVLTPFIYWLIRSKIEAFMSIVILFIVAGFYDLLPFHIVNEDALFYYSSGAFAGAWLKSRIKDTKPGYLVFWLKTGLISAGVMIISIYLYAYLGSGRFFNSFTSYRLTLFGEILYRESGAIFIFALVNLVLAKVKNDFSLRRPGKKNTSSRFAAITASTDNLPGFMHCSFLIFALHYLEIRFFRTVFSFCYILVSGQNLSLTPVNECIDILIFLFMPLMCVLITYGFDLFMRCFSPRILAVISGNRG